MAVMLDARELRLLEGLRMKPRKSFAGRIRGERLTARKGVSIEFSDYRDYTEGDDLRHLDWNVLARLDSPVMRTYRDEEDLAVHLLLDASPSMEFGEPSKQDVAARLACALGTVALGGGDAVYPRVLGTREPPRQALRGRASVMRLAGRLEVGDAPTQSLAAAIRGFAASSARLGMVVVVSDGLDPDVPAAIRALGGRGHDVLFLQVLSDLDLDPDLEGDLRLIDAEGGHPVEITANGDALKEYRKRLEVHNRALSDSVLRVGGRLATTTTSVTVERFVRETLKREGWVQ